MKRIVFKRGHCLKPKQSKRRIRYIKDKAVKKFLLQHMTPVKIDFSKLENCLLNRIFKDDNIVDKVFPKPKEAKSEINPQSKN